MSIYCRHARAFHYDYGAGAAHFGRLFPARASRARRFRHAMQDRQGISRRALVGRRTPCFRRRGQPGYLALFAAWPLFLGAHCPHDDTPPSALPTHCSASPRCRHCRDYAGGAALIPRPRFSMMGGPSTRDASLMPLFAARLDCLCVRSRAQLCRLASDASAHRAMPRCSIFHIGTREQSVYQPSADTGARARHARLCVERFWPRVTR